MDSMLWPDGELTMILTGNIYLCGKSHGCVSRLGSILYFLGEGWPGKVWHLYPANSGSLLKAVRKIVILYIKRKTEKIRLIWFISVCGAYLYFQSKTEATISWNFRQVQDPQHLLEDKDSSNDQWKWRKSWHSQMNIVTSDQSSSVVCFLLHVFFWKYAIVMQDNSHMLLIVT